MSDSDHAWCSARCAPHGPNDGLPLVAGPAGCSLRWRQRGEEPRSVRERSPDKHVEFTSRQEATCAGEIDGAAYEILMPQAWNGTLLMADPLVLVQNESVFAARSAANDERSSDLVQLYSVPPASYSPEVGAPYGAGHCNVSTDERLGMIALLDGWARDGVYPVAAAVKRAFGDENGYEPNYKPAAWPTELDR